MRIRVSLLLPLPLLALASCGPVLSRGALTARDNPSLYSVHQPVVQQRVDVIDLSAGDGLASGEGERLGAWLDTMAVRPGDRLWLASPSEAARFAVADVAGRRGLPVYADTASEMLAPGIARVRLARVTASVPNCPDWRNSGQFGAPISTDTNYGCAAASNLAAMVADPNDLLRGRSAGEMVNGDDAAKAVKTYRDRTQTGITGYSTGQGPVIRLDDPTEGDDE